MFRSVWSPRLVSSVYLKHPTRFAISRSISEDAKQDILQRLLTEDPIYRVENITLSKKEQFEATISGFLPSDFPRSRNHLSSRLRPGGHLMFWNTLVPTENLLPDGTDTAHSPPAPWSQRLWAGGRILFPQHKYLDYAKSQRAVLTEYVGDARIAGPEDKEKVFVKIERRLLPRIRTGPEVAIQQALALPRDSNDIVGRTLLVETRDLCFLREKKSPAPFERRHIVPPSDPDYSHSLTPTPALLFRYSALTFNAHAIHIDPEYTRNVYGFPNLLVHGPLALTLMLEYMGQILLGLPGKGYAPVITEINYRNLAPLFAKEEMTICVKGKRSVESASSSPPASANESRVDIMKGFPTPPSGEHDTAVILQVENPNLEPVKPLKAKATPSGIDVGESIPMPSPADDGPVGTAEDDYSEVKFKAQTSQSSPSYAASAEAKYPYEWDIWIQTGQGATASLAVRGTIKIEEFDEAKQLQEMSEKKEAKTQKVDYAKYRASGLTAEEVQMLEKVKRMLEKTGGKKSTAKSEPSSKQENHTAQEIPIRKFAHSGEPGPTKPLIRFHSKEGLEWTRSNTEIADLSKKQNQSIQTRGRVPAIRKISVLKFKTIKVGKAYDIRSVPNKDGITQKLVDDQGENVFGSGGLSSSNIAAVPIGESKIHTSAEGAFERTLRKLLEGK